MLLLAVACGDSAADEAVGDRLAERLVESLRERVRDRQRRNLPLPDDALLREVDVDRLSPDESFRVDLVDDLVIGGRDDDVNYMFGRMVSSWSLTRVAVDLHGRIFVLPFVDRATRVRVFGADGEYLYRFARWGEGPGGLLSPRWLIVASDRVLVFHRRTQWSIWESNGRYVRDRPAFLSVDREVLLRVLPSKRVLAASGLDDGSVVVMSPAIPIAEIQSILPGVRVTVSRFDPTGNEAQQYFNVPETAHPRIAVSLDGEIYASFVGAGGGEYYVVAWAADGSPRWFTALEPIDDETSWAELRLDDAGHLFVMPSYGRLQPPEDPRRPVHVFTTEGEFINSGYLNRRPEWLHWQAAREGKVYGARQSETTHEWEIVRYRVEISGGPY